MWRKLAFGYMRMRPDDFWNMSLIEWGDAIAGLAEKNGSRPSEGMTSAELEELMEQYPDA